VLSDQERNLLIDVECYLMAEDPELVRIFSDEPRQQPEMRMKDTLATVIAVLVTLVLSVIILIQPALQSLSR
jgi:hypothetical protein